nr:phytanoyl-CoA dioxygenase family protein [Amycolatopsis rubida]
MLEAKDKYDRDGWFQSPELLAKSLIGELRESVERISLQTRPEVVYEKGSRIVRAIHGCHAFDEACARLVRLPALLDLAHALIGEPVYVYQFKVNLKQPYAGAAWPWHQDYAFWNREDGMPSDRVVNLAIFLDDTYEGNGPLQVIPGTHRLGIIEPGDERMIRATGDWRKHVSADLEHTVPLEYAERLIEERGKFLLVGASGTLCAFHPSIVHSSSDNLSGNRRALLLITYNSVNNVPAHPNRPEFLVGRDTAPVVGLEDGRA